MPSGQQSLTMGKCPHTTCRKEKASLSLSPSPSSLSIMNKLVGDESSAQTEQCLSVWPRKETMSDEVTLEGTLAIIKPDVAHKEAQILEIVRQEGFLVVERARFRFTEKSARRFYAPLRTSPRFDDLVSYVTEGDCIGLCLAREDGLRRWRDLLGPTEVSVAMRDFPSSLRARYGDPGDDLRNGLHGSESPEESEREIEMIFPHILHGGEGELEENREPFFCKLVVFQTPMRTATAPPAAACTTSWRRRSQGHRPTTRCTWKGDENTFPNRIGITSTLLCFLQQIRDPNLAEGSQRDVRDPPQEPDLVAGGLAHGQQPIQGLKGLTIQHKRTNKKNSYSKRNNKKNLLSTHRWLWILRAVR